MIRTSLIFYASKHNPYVEQILNLSNDFFKCFHFGFNALPCVIDRQGLLNKYCNIPIQTNFPYNLHSNPSFEDCGNQSSQVYSKVNVALSGIDSLTALCFLLANGKQVHAIYNDELDPIISTCILPDLRRRFNFTYEYKQYSSIFDILSTTNIVTGEMGDQLLGSYFCYINPDIGCLPWKEGIIQYIKHNINFKNYNIQLNIDEVINMSEITVNNALFNISNFFDFLKWINFNFIFDYDCNKYLFLPNVHHFFSTNMFQSWSVNNHEIQKNNYSVNSYKKVYKDYIYKISKNDKCFELHKSPSVTGNIEPSKESIVAINSNKQKFKNDILGHTYLRSLI